MGDRARFGSSDCLLCRPSRRAERILPENQTIDIEESFHLSVKSSF